MKHNRPARTLVRSFATFLFMGGMALSLLHGADGTWDGDTDTVFHNSANWVNGVVPNGTSSNNAAYFPSSFTPFFPSLTTARNVYGLFFLKPDGGWIIGGAGYTLRIGTGGIDDTANQSGITTIEPNIEIANNQTWATGTGGTLRLNGRAILYNGNRILTIGGTVVVAQLDSDTTTRTLTKSGSGTLVLTGPAAANMQGGFSLSRGTLILHHPLAIGTGTFRAGSSTDDTTLRAGVDLSGTNALPQTVEWVGQFTTLNVFEGTNTISFSGPVTGPPSGSAINISNNLPAGCTLSFTGSSWSIGSGAQSGINITFRGSGRTVILNAISNGTPTVAGAIVMAGSGILELAGNNTYTGQTAVNSGVLLLSSANALPGGIGPTGGLSYLYINGGVVGLGYNDFTRETTADPHPEKFRWATGGFAAFGQDRTVNIGGDGRTIAWGANFVLPGIMVLGASSADRTLTFLNPLNLNNGHRTNQVEDGAAEIDAVLAGTISQTGGGSFTKTGPGTLLLSALNTYSGPTHVREGTLRVGGSTGSGLVTVYDGASISGTGRVAALTFESGGRLVPYDTGAGTPSCIIVTGAVNLAGAILDGSKLGTLSAGDHPVLLCGSRSGEFSSTVNLPKGRIVAYTDTSVILKASRAGTVISLR